MPSRSLRAAFGETPDSYLQRRRVERSMFMLRETDRAMTDIYLGVGFGNSIRILQQGKGN